MEKAKARKDGQLAGNGIRQALIKPANRTGANSTKDHTLSPSLTENPVELPLTPQSEQTLGVPAAHIDGVLRQNERLQILWRAKQRKMSGFAPQSRKSGYA